MTGISVKEAIEERKRRILFEYHTAIEDRVVDLMIAGYTMTDFFLMHYPESRAVLMVNGKPDSEFQIVTTRETIAVVGRSMRTECKLDE